MKGIKWKNSFDIVTNKLSEYTKRYNIPLNIEKVMNKKYYKGNKLKTIDKGKGKIYCTEDYYSQNRKTIYRLHVRGEVYLLGNVTLIGVNKLFGDIIIINSYLRGLSIINEDREKPLLLNNTYIDYNKRGFKDLDNVSVEEKVLKGGSIESIKIENMCCELYINKEKREKSKGYNREKKVFNDTCVNKSKNIDSLLRGEYYRDLSENYTGNNNYNNSKRLNKKIKRQECENNLNSKSNYSNGIKDYYGKI